MINSDFYRFNRRERRAVYILLPALVGISFLRAHLLHSDEAEFSSDDWQRARLLFEQHHPLMSTVPDLLEINLMDSSDLVASGLSPKQAAAVILYRNARSGFANADELLTCQYIPDHWIETNLKQIKFSPGISNENRTFTEQTARDTVEFTNPKFNTYLVKPRPLILDINQADSAQLEQLPGIGAAMAGRIIKYRERLGGFLNLEQLLELYGMKIDNYLKFKDLVKIDENFRPNFICINTCTKDELANHPYIQRRLANSLINIREQHGPYAEIEGLKFSALMNDSIYELIRPYISICAGSSTRDP